MLKYFTSIVVGTLLLFATSLQAENNYEGKWIFQSITNTQSDTLVPVTESDFMLLGSDGSFAYELAAKNNLKANGRFKLSDKQFSFHYKIPNDTSRYYKLLDLTENKLKFQENDVIFTFKKSSAKTLIKLNESGESRIYSIFRGSIGLLVLILIAFLCSSNRKKISWPLVIKGFLIQFAFAAGVLYSKHVAKAFDFVSDIFVKVIGFTQSGTDFLLNSFVTDQTEIGLLNFAFQVLPTIIFFSALTSLFYYWGILQRIVYVFAWIMKKIMGLSGAESLAASGNIFLGQTEAPLLVKPYLMGMTKSEIMCLMSGGMATIAGGVLAAYIGFLGDGNEAQELFFAKHLLAASVMSAPAAVIAAKMIVPETEEFNASLEIPKDKIGSNALEAISNGTTDGLKLAINVAAMLLVFTALMTMGNFVLKDLIGHYTGINEMIAASTAYDGLSFQFLIGYACAPIAWVMGVPSEDMVLVGQLIGEKTILNEFYAYKTLGEMKTASVFSYEKSIIIATYVLCGFANFASIGIQIGGIGALIPSRKGLLSKLGVRALIAGTLACMFTAVIVGMLI